MTPLTLDLDYDRPTALLQPDAHGQPQQIALVIDWERKTISAEARDPNLDGIPETRWRGLEDAYSLPPLVDATQLREWVEEEVLPRAAPLADVYRTVWEDVEQYGRQFVNIRIYRADRDALAARMRYGETMADAIHALMEWTDKTSDDPYPD